MSGAVDRPAAPAPRLARETFKTSRLAEFTSERELVVQIGHPARDWPVVAGKELVENAIDACEEAGIAPVVGIEVSTETGEIVVVDNGPGIPSEAVDSIIDFSARTSSRAGYVAPTRGQQGNALQTIIAMPFALDREIGNTVTIEALGVAHRIRFTIDPIKQNPRITVDPAPSTVRNGSRVTVHWPAKASHLLDAAADQFLPLGWAFTGVNPHLNLMLDVDSDRLIDAAEPTNPDWAKWRPSDPIPPHWYRPASLQRYIAACVNRDLEAGGAVRSVRDFLGGFRGLAGTAKRSAVLNETGLFRARLDVFFRDEQVDHAGIARLLDAMQRHGRAPKPEALGLIGEEHLRWTFADDGADEARFRYCRVLGEDAGLPFVVEAAFAPAAERSTTPLISGVNWSPALITNPFRHLGRYSNLSLDWVLTQQHIDLENDPVLVAVHVATPAAQFTDRGKSVVALGPTSGAAIIDAVTKVTKGWAADWEARQRERYRSKRDTERWLAAQERAERRDQRERERDLDQQLAAARAAEREAKRQRSETVGTGALHAEIATAAEQAGVAIKDLVVLSKSNDPYLRDTSEGHENGLWFPGQVDRFIAPDKSIHLRGLFYLIVAAGGVKRPDGSAFVNDDDAWIWFQSKAAKAARWLGYLPFERIRDERNSAPLVIANYAVPEVGHIDLSPGEHIELPPFNALLPYLAGSSPVAQQPCRIILIGEKSSLGEALEPIAREVKGTLLLPTGEASDTMIADEVMRAVGDARRAVVAYFSDFDPSGWQMPISVARKLQALRTLHHPDLQIEVHRVALTLAQVRELDLPSMPLKATEKRAANWRENMGHEQTEIDALAALRPGELARIAREALRPFFDFGLEERCRAALDERSEEARRRLADHPARESAEREIGTAFKAVQKAYAALADAQAAALQQLREGDHTIAGIEIPVPELQIEAIAPPPLFSSSDDFVTATRKLISSKALLGTEDDDR